MNLDHRSFFPQASFLSSVMSSLHLLDPLVQNGSTNDGRSLFLSVIGWVLDMDIRALMVSGNQADPSDSTTENSTGVAFAIKGYVSCLKQPGREALQIRTQATGLLPGVLLALTAAMMTTPSPTPQATTRAAELLSQVMEAVQWITDEYWSSDSKSLPR